MEPDASPFGVEEQVRPLTDAEAAFVRERLEGWHREVGRTARRTPRELFAGAGGGLVVAGIGAARGSGAVLFAGAVVAAVLAALGAVAQRRARKAMLAARGPWDAPEGGWRVREIRVRARAVVDASGTYLYEIPGGDWFFVDRLSLPDSAAPLARAELRLTALFPDGVFLAAEPSGAALPEHALGGAIWSPPDDAWRGNADGRIAEAALPEAVRTIVSAA